MKKTLKFTYVCYLLIANFCVTNSLLAQNPIVQNSDFASINKEWEGQLKYLNYGDDTKIVTIPCSLKTEYENGKIKSKIEFDELDKKGKKMTSKSKFRLSKNGKFFIIDGEKWAISSMKNKDQSIQIIAQKRGKDNDQSADLKITWTLVKDTSISWKKDVKYDGTDQFFNRNIFEFTKK